VTLASVEAFFSGGGESADGWTGLKRFLLVRTVDRAGLAGWGEAYVLSGREAAVAAMVRSLGEAYAGRPATPRPFRHWAIRDFGGKHGGIDFYAAVSALELALWDLAGKRLGVPVYRLLGGAVRERIAIYANIWSDRRPSAEAMAARATESVAAGFRAIKVYPMRGGDLGEAEACLAAIRAAVGPSVSIMVDVHCMDDAHLALQAGRRFAAYDPFWYEKPVTSAAVRAVEGRPLAKLVCLGHAGCPQAGDLQLDQQVVERRTRRTGSLRHVPDDGRPQIVTLDDLCFGRRPQGRLRIRRSPRCPIRQAHAAELSVARMALESICPSIGFGRTRT